MNTERFAQSLKRALVLVSGERPQLPSLPLLLDCTPQGLRLLKIGTFGDGSPEVVACCLQHVFVSLPCTPALAQLEVCRQCAAQREALDHRDWFVRRRPSEWAGILRVMSALQRVARD